MRSLKVSAGGELIVDGAEDRARLELAGPDNDRSTVDLAPGELLAAIETLAMVYAELCGARPESLARGVNRTLRNRIAAARQRQAGGQDSPKSSGRSSDVRR
jgi:hypothetical protein